MDVSTIGELVTNETNIVYIYLTEDGIDKMSLDLTLRGNFIERLRGKFKFNAAKPFVAFYRNNMSYTYEVSNDNQICQRLTLKKHKKMRLNDRFNVAINLYNEQKNPCYMFPSSDEISARVEYSIEDYKINNRITLNIYTSGGDSCVYIMYRHSANADLDHNQECINRLLNQL